MAARGSRRVEGLRRAWPPLLGRWRSARGPALDAGQRRGRRTERLVLRSLDSTCGKDSPNRRGQGPPTEVWTLQVPRPSSRVPQLPWRVGVGEVGGGRGPPTACLIHRSGGDRQGERSARILQPLHAALAEPFVLLSEAPRCVGGPVHDVAVDDDFSWEELARLSERHWSLESGQQRSATTPSATLPAGPLGHYPEAATAL